MYTQIIKNIAKITESHRQKAKESGSEFNIFKVIGLTSQEVRVHSAMLCELLNPKGSHKQGDTFLKLFVEHNNIKNFNTSTAVVEMEKYIGTATENSGGRIDIYISDSSGNSIIIENKIYAGDQHNQLVRYKKHSPNGILLYLTLDGNYASEFSRKDMEEGIDYFAISYKNDITVWLEKCYEHSRSIPILSQGIAHYINIIKLLTGQTNSTNMKKDIAEYLSVNPEYLSGVIEIVDSIKYVNINIQTILWSKIAEGLIKNGYKVIYYNWDDITNHLSEHIEKFALSYGSHRWYGIEVEITEKDDLSFRWRIELDNNIFYGIKIRRKDNKHLQAGEVDFERYRRIMLDSISQFKTTSSSPSWLVWQHTPFSLNFKQFKSTDIFSILESDRVSEEIIRLSLLYIQEIKQIVDSK